MSATPTDDERILWGVVANARRNAKFGRQSRALWALVSDATALGSTASFTLCRRFGFNPDSTKAESDKGPSTAPARCDCNNTVHDCRDLPNCRVMARIRAAKP